MYVRLYRIHSTIISVLFDVVKRSSTFGTHSIRSFGWCGWSEFLDIFFLYKTVRYRCLSDKKKKSVFQPNMIRMFWHWVPLYNADAAVAYLPAYREKLVFFFFCRWKIAYTVGGGSAVLTCRINRSPFIRFLFMWRYDAQNIKFLWTLLKKERDNGPERERAVDILLSPKCLIFYKYT